MVFIFFPPILVTLDAVGPAGTRDADLSQARLRDRLPGGRASLSRRPSLAQGVSKEEARLTGWVRDLAPSTELRLWYHRDPARFGEFRERYRKEQTAPAAELALLAKEARRTPVTLVFSAREADRSNAAVLKELLEELG